MSFFSAATMFFLVMDPIGGVPLFLAALRTVEDKRRQWVILRELLIALAIMVLFLFAGNALLSLLHVEPAALEAAGGVILLLIAVRMVFPEPDKTLHVATLGEPFVVPLAIPYIAGPSLLALEIILISSYPSEWPMLLGALLAAWGLGAVILYASGFLSRVLGEKTLTALERLMGMILVILSMQMLMSGIREFFPGV